MTYKLRFSPVFGLSNFPERASQQSLSKKQLT